MVILVSLVVMVIVPFLLCTTNFELPRNTTPQQGKVAVCHSREAAMLFCYLDYANLEKLLYSLGYHPLIFFCLIFCFQLKNGEMAKTVVSMVKNDETFPLSGVRFISFS